MINLDRNLYDFNKELEMKDKSLSKDVKEIENNIFSQLEKESETLSNSKEKLSFYNKANKYLEERFPYDFFYIGKDNINNSIKKSKTYIKK